MNLQAEIINFVSQAPISPVDLVSIMRTRYPELTTNDIKMAISPLLSVGDLTFEERKLVVVKKVED